jgi:hypothetical protein
MDSTTYLAAWLLAALVAIGILSWQLARYTQRHDVRAAQAQRLGQALQRYSDWVCAQRLAAVFDGEGEEAAAALDEACTIRLGWFPDLAGEMAELLAVHNRIVNFLATQQALWLRDPEHWLDSEHDKRFMALWRQHRFALQAVLACLERATRVRIATHPAPQRDTTYA